MTATIATPIDPRLQRPVPRYTSYPTVPAWNTEVGADAYRDGLLRLAGRGRRPVSLYVHLPFCRVRCLYCGCNVTITAREERMERYLDRLETEQRMMTETIGGEWPVAHLHMGGGTPNYLEDRQFLRLMDIVGRGFTFGEDSELSVEAEPRLVNAMQLELFANLGFTRISYGVQDLEADVQAAIGRIQSAALVGNAVTSAREAGFTGVNLDLIYGLPRQTLEGFDRTLQGVIAMAPDRVACFGYAHVPWMQKQQTAINASELPDSQLRLALFELAIQRFEEAGYVWIGLDHFAKPGDDLEVAFREHRLTRDFMGYTTRPTDTLLALGASAIGDVDGLFVQNEAAVTDWEAKIGSGAFATVRGHMLTHDDRLRRDAIASLMCNLRLPLSLGGGPLGDSMDRLLGWATSGLVAVEGEYVVVTRTGRLFLRTLCAEFDAYLGPNPTTRFSRGV
jgi:oxygen-independent coproporphyrinogen-3 oxidase